VFDHRFGRNPTSLPWQRRSTLRTTKKGKVLLGRRKADATGEACIGRTTGSRNCRSRGRADRLLEAMASSPRRTVRPTMRAKFTQNQRIPQAPRHVLDDAGLRTLGREITILDCGCVELLTLAVHHYLNDVLTIPARIVGGT